MTRRMVMVSMIALLTVCALITLAPTPSYSQECRIVRVFEEQGAQGRVVRIDPDVLTVKKGTCVVWVNWVTASGARVNFMEDGKRCQDATEAAVGFKAVENCYLTDYLRLGGTSSLRFNEAGTFKYRIEIPDERMSMAGPTAVATGIPSSQGQIVVQE